MGAFPVGRSAPPADASPPPAPPLDDGIKLGRGALEPFGGGVKLLIEGGDRVPGVIDLARIAPESKAPTH